MSILRNTIIASTLAMNVGVAFAGGTSSGAGFARPIESEANRAAEIETAYLDSEFASQIRSKLEDNFGISGVSFSEKIGVHNFDSLCGFAGCETSHLVVHTFTPEMVNAQSANFFTLVSEHTYYEGVEFVRMVESKIGEDEVVEVQGESNKERAAEVFVNSALVKDRIASWDVAFPNHELLPVQVSELGESCGFAGCSSAYAVSLTANTQTAGQNQISIVAVVRDVLAGQKSMIVNELGFKPAGTTEQ